MPLAELGSIGIKLNLITKPFKQMNFSVASSVPETFRLTFRCHGGSKILPWRPRRAIHINLNHPTPPGVARAGSQFENQGDETVPRPSLLPAGKRQARVELPALFVTIPSADVAASLGDIAAAVAGIVGIVISITSMLLVCYWYVTGMLLVCY